MKLRNYLELPTQGDVGIELEIEGEVSPVSQSKYWESKHDGSLRGGLEYVTQGAIPLAEVGKAMVFLNRIFEKRGAKPVFSFRTSSHVHVNVLDLDEQQYLNTVYLYWLFEPVLIEASGDSRKSNRFCLSTRDSDSPISSLIKTFRVGFNWRNIRSVFRPDYCKYSAINLATTGSLGTIEVRTMEGSLDPERIENWCKLLVAIREYGAKSENLMEIHDTINEVGVRRFFAKVAGDVADYFDYPNLDNDIELQRSLLIDVLYLSKGVKIESKDSSVQKRKPSGVYDQVVIDEIDRFVNTRAQAPIDPRRGVEILEN